MKKLLAAVATGLVITALLIATAVRSRGASSADAPEKCLDQMFDAMKAGDIAAYLKCFTGRLREELERTAKEQTAAGFSAYLKQSAGAIKGRAILHHKTESSGSDQVRMVVDRVYEQRMWEYQAYRLQRQAGAWRIYAIDAPEPHEPPIPYGTPAFVVEEPSEPATPPKAAE